MEYLLTQTEMQELDRFSIEELGVPQYWLMENAAQAIVDEIIYANPPQKRVLFVVEGGNNGGDGLAAARILKNYDPEYEVLVYYTHGINRVSEAFLYQYQSAVEQGVVITELMPEKQDFDIVVDGIFGVGLSRDVKGVQAEVISWMNRLSAYKIAIDIPSGIHATTGAVLGCAFKADTTITFGYLKTGMVMYPGKEYAGEVEVEDIGFPAAALQHTGYQYFSYGNHYDVVNQVMKQYPVRVPRSHKGTYGKVMLIAGSKGMAGAASFAALAAYRCGCGLVYIVTHESNRVILQMRIPEAVVLSYENAEQAIALVDQNWDQMDAVMVGSGLSLSEEACQIVKKVIHYNCEKMNKKPVVVDGDALTILAQNPELLEQYLASPVEKRPCLVLTPHLKEMERLCKKSMTEIQEHLLTVGMEYIKEIGAPQDFILVLKDARSVVNAAKYPAYINMTGNHGMATAGSGDVLAGMLSALLALHHKKKTKNYYQAVCMAVCLHGAAADTIRAKTGTVSMMASDLLDGIVQVMKIYDEVQDMVDTRSWEEYWESIEKERDKENDIL